MASVYKRNNSWYIRYQHAGKKYREAVGPSKRDAERVLMKRLTEIVEGKFLDIRQRCKVTFDEYKPRFLQWSKTHKRSWARDERLVKNLSTHFGSLNLEAITPAKVERYKARRLSGELTFGEHGQTAGPSTVNRELACLRRMLNLASEWGVLAENHLAGKIKLLREPEGRTLYLAPSEAERLLSECAEHLRPVVHLALLTGMRRGELLGLTWDEVSLGRGTIRLPGTRTKNGRPRTIPLSMEARGQLAQLKRAKVEGCVLVFHRDGHHLGNIRKAFESACRRAGLKDFRFHDLRHSFASALAMAGVPLQAIGEILGHRTLSMTQRYAHLSPSVLTNAAERASAYLENKQESIADAAEPTPLYSNEEHQATG